MNIPAVAELEYGEAEADFLLGKLEEYKLRGDLWIEPGTSATDGGIQTKNLLTVGDAELEGYLSTLKADLESAVGVGMSYFWAHMIEYERGGSQKVHSHEHNEDVSFVLYLNDCEGGRTHFLINEARDVRTSFLPRKGHGVIFLASLKHYAEDCPSPKKVLVCGLRLA